MKPQIALVRLSALGDIIITSHVTEMAEKNGCEVVFVTHENAKELAFLLPGVSIFIFLKDDGSLRCVNRMDAPVGVQSLAIQKIIDLQVTGRSKKAIRKLRGLGITAAVEETEKRTGFRLWLVIKSHLYFKQKKSEAPLFKKDVMPIWKIQQEKVMSVLRGLGIQNPQVLSQERGSTLLHPKLEKTIKLPSSFVALFIGASGPLKEWPLERFFEFAKMCMQKNLSVVFLGGVDLILPSDLQNEKSVNLCKKTSLSELSFIVSKAKYVVTGDTLAAHLAEGFGIPASVIFGATSPLFGFIPTAENITLHTQNLNCSPCTRHGKGSCRFNNVRCLKDITPQKVIDEAKFS